MKFEDANPCLYVAGVITHIVAGHPQARSATCCPGLLYGPNQDRGLRTALTLDQPTPPTRAANLVNASG